MDIIPLTINIAGRNYPMKVAVHDEALVRQAAQLVNEQLADYRQKFNIQDNQDLLAIIAFDCIFEKLNRKNSEEFDYQTFNSQIERLLAITSEALQ